MKIGTVVLLNSVTQRCAVRLDDDEHSIVEMLDDLGLALGDLVSGPLDEIGCSLITNRTTGMTGKVHIDDTTQDRATAIRSLRLP